MILKAKDTHTGQITNLWSEAFGDTQEDVLKFLEFLLEYFYVYEENGVVCAMAAVLPLNFKGERGGYIYAVATKENMRGRGISTKLLNYIKTLTEYDFFVLVPQSESLFDFYKRFGFKPFSCAKRKNISASSDIDSNFLCEIISAEEYANFRKDFFEGKLVEWDLNVLEFAKKMYKGNFYCASVNGEKSGVCFCFEDYRGFVIKEILAKNDEELSKKIVAYFHAEKASVSFPDFSAPPSAMVFPVRKDGIYFNIALD